MIGNGAQSEFQALAMHAVCGIDRLRLYDIDGAATEKTVRNLSSHGFDLVPCSDMGECFDALREVVGREVTDAG